MKKNIPIGVKTPWREGEQKVKQLSKLVRYDVNMNDFRDFMDTKTMNNTVKQAKKFLKIFVISSAEAERGFSSMNTICTALRNRLAIDTIRIFMIIRLLGKFLEMFDSLPYIK